MHLRPLLALACLFLVSITGHASSLENSPQITWYPDLKTPKLVIWKIENQIMVLENEDSATKTIESYLKKESVLYGIESDLKNLELLKVKKSLLGQHYYYRQIQSDFPVENGEIVVSILPDNRTIYQVYNSISKLKPITKKEKLILTKDQAYNIAWKNLGVTGKIMAEPTAEIIWFPTKKGLRQAWKVFYSTSEPFGDWVQIINAENGSILTKKNTMLPRKKTALPAWAHENKSRNRLEAIKQYHEKENAIGQYKLEQVNGTAIVFNPDPRTSLMNKSLTDNSPDSDFADAYQEVILRDISYNGDRYSLTGPWVSIKDFENPSTRPSTSNTGDWKDRRGNNSFNDAMTYFHIDQSQRYIQSLGFKGDTGIQQLSIEVDTDGLNGADNSHFRPSTNQLAFGHGCVDDNEDADVILHEYGHAIQHDISENWNGGDTGAIGEGFGDYWAGSHSISTENGLQFFPNEVFTWDGHGESNACWPGRIMNALNTVYEHDQNYGAHVTLPNGRQSDELWSTPIFQALLELTDMGYTREEVDKIVLQSHFGLGYGVKMRDMATATVNSARIISGDEVAEIFTEKFANHGILDLPKVNLIAENYNTLDQDNNPQVDPGDNVKIDIALKNIGSLEAARVSGNLSTDIDTIEFRQSKGTWDDLTPSDEAQFNIAPFIIELSESHKCGDPLLIDLNVNYNDSTKRKIPINIATGRPNGVDLTKDADKDIPDNSERGVTSSIFVDITGEPSISENLRISIDISHTFVGDLVIKLTAPDGSTTTLHSRSGSGQDDIIGIYPTTLDSETPLSGLYGGPLNGEWKLTIQDLASRDQGTLNSWGIKDITSYSCN